MTAPERKRMLYLDWLIRHETGYGPTAPKNLHKRHNWLHFCLRCGLDISHTYRGSRYCRQCKSQNITMRKPNATT